MVVLCLAASQRSQVLAGCLLLPNSEDLLYTNDIRVLVALRNENTPKITCMAMHVDVAPTSCSLISGNATPRLILHIISLTCPGRPVICRPSAEAERRDAAQTRFEDASTSQDAKQGHRLQQLTSEAEH